MIPIDPAPVRLRRHGGVPLYRQIESALLARIRSGELRSGDRLPPETELARTWKVHRLTVRQAIGELARAGHVVVRQGAGTYVAAPPLLVAVDLPPLPATQAEATSTEAVAALGHDLVETITAIAPDARREPAEALDVDPAALVRLDAVHEAADTIWMVSNYWLDGCRFPGIERLAVGSMTPYRLLRDAYGVRLRYAWRSLVAAPAPAADAAIMDVPPGIPVMLREGLNVDDDGIPTLFLSRRMRGDRIKYVLRYTT